MNDTHVLLSSLHQENPFERILSRELLEMVEAAEVVVVVHRHSCNSEDLFDMRIQLHRNNMKYLYYNNAVSAPL